MSEPAGNIGKDLNTTFLPQALLRKTDNKANSTLAHKCNSVLMQTNFKKHLEMLSSLSTHPKLSMQATSSTNLTLLQFVLLIEPPYRKELLSFLHKVQHSALKITKKEQLPQECHKQLLSCFVAISSNTKLTKFVLEHRLITL